MAIRPVRESQVSTCSMQSSGLYPAGLVFFLIFNLERKARMTLVFRGGQEAEAREITLQGVSYMCVWVCFPTHTVPCTCPTGAASCLRSQGPTDQAQNTGHHTTPSPPETSWRAKQPMIHLHGEGNGNPLLYSCLGNPIPIDRGAWRATVHGVAESGTRPSDPAGTHEPPPGPHNSTYSCSKSD